MCEFYPEECSCAFEWARAFVKHLEGDAHEAGTLALTAQFNNRFFAPYIAGEKALPKSRPGGYSLGTADEAKTFAFIVGPGWLAWPEAVKFVKDFLASYVPPSRRKPRKEG